MGRRTLPRAAGPWALDSGGYTALDQPPHRWVLSPEDYAAEVARFSTIGGLMWAAPQDWMCEPWIVEKTGLSVEEHQERTVQNYVDLGAFGRRFIPVLQGFTYEDYERCIDLYQQAGIDLRFWPLVGLGTVCRRQATDEIATLIEELAAYGLRLHGFGVKTRGLVRYRDLLHSADSMAWSYNARRNPQLRIPGHTHKNCANCFEFAMQWADRLETRLND